MVATTTYSPYPQDKEEIAAKSTPNRLSAALGFKTELSLLPHQLELMQDIKTRIIGLVSGYGGG